MRRRRRALILVTCALLLLGVPMLGDVYLTYILTLAGINVIVVAGLTLFIGYTGQLSLGHAAFYGMGAYCSALLTKQDVPFPVALAAAGLLGGLAGLLVGFPALRLRGFYLAMATLAFGLIAYQLFKNLEGITGGVSGMTRIPSASLGPVSFANPALYYYVVLAVLGVGLLVVAALALSPTGRVFRAIAGQELAAMSLGIDTYRLKTISFSISAVFAGAAGSLHAHLHRFVSPDDFTFFPSVMFLTMAILGGFGNVLGGSLAAVLITLASEQLRAFGRAQPLFFGLGLILLVVFLPQGLMSIGGRYASLRSRWGSWRAERARGRISAEVS
ncbi:MAG: branched-chain amino acid ABC transporter permease [Chloroflexi bacterium]|nr:branched-chain amino acid ABC transporter permease [Chloroflexota bacterium]